MAQTAPPERRTLQTTDEVMADMFGYWQEIKQRKADGIPVVLAPVTMPYEIFRAMDVPVEPLDNIGSMVPALRLSPKYCKIAEQRGLPRDTCSPLPDQFIDHGDRTEQLAEAKLDVESLVSRVKNALAIRPLRQVQVARRVKG